jgi:S-adenosylmethionine hydrolase
MPNPRQFGIFGLALFALLMTGLSPARAATPLIGLFTDYGWDDPYVAQLKGVITTINPNVRILDLMHTVTPYNIVEGSYLLEQCAEEFPAGTIFVAVVDPEVGTSRDPILIETTKGKFFIGPDNGLFSDVIAHEGLSRAWKLDHPQFFRAGTISHTFHGRDIFAPVAAHLAEGADLERFGTPIKTLALLPDKQPTFAGNQITAEVLHVDHFGNVILNVPGDSEVAARLKEGDLIRISIGKESYSAPMVKNYAEVAKGRLVLLYGGSGLLEIGMNQGSAVRQLRVEPGTSVFLKP